MANHSSSYKTGSVSNVFKILLILMIIAGCVIALVQFLTIKDIKTDESLLATEMNVDINDALFNSLSQSNKKALIDSYKKPEEYLPAQSLLPYFSPEQQRPSRDLIKKSADESEKLVFLKEMPKSKLLSSLETFDLAYSLTKSPQYLERVLESIGDKPSLTIDELICVLEFVKNQKQTVSYIPSELYFKFMNTAINTLSVQATDLIDPLKAIKAYYSINLLPVGINMDNLVSVIKPILEDAFHHKNRSRKDQLFLSSLESTEFSLMLINAVWQFKLDNKKIPEWLYQLAEKESCRLAFRLEPDGCLPDWSGKNSRINLTEAIYKASLVFDRDDLRFIAFGGRRIQDATPPKQKTFYFPEIGEYIVRNNWNIYHFSNPIQNDYLAYKRECFQVTVNLNESAVSIYAATAHFGVIKCKLPNVKSVLDLTDFIKINDDSFETDIEINAKIKINDINLAKLYRLEGEKILAFNRTEYLSDWECFKPVWNVERIKLDEKFILSLKMIGTYKIFVR